MTKPLPDSDITRGGLRDFFVLLAVVSLIAAAALRFVPFSTPITAGHLRVLEDLIHGHRVPYTPYALGYYVFSAVAVRFAGWSGLFVAQALVYAGIVFTGYLILRELGLRRIAVWGALAFYPNMPLNIKRYVDTEVISFFLVMYVYFMVRLKRRGPSEAYAVTGGLLAGLMLFLKPNLMSVLPLTALLFWRAPSESVGKKLAYLGTMGATALTVLTAGIVPLKGRFVVFDPLYGAYTFYNGTHHRAVEGILSDYNGELSTPAAMQDLGIPFVHMEDRSHPEMVATYWRLGREYISAHPAEYGLLLGLKVVNLFRPDYRNPGARPFASGRLVMGMQTLIACIFPMWGFLRWRCRQLLGWTDGLLAVPFLLLYLFPFVLTNTDTRYRVPFDGVLILESVFCLWVLANGGVREKNT